MDKKSINLNNLEKFLKKARSKLEEGIEDIGENNMIKLNSFLSEIRDEKTKKLSLIHNGNEINFGIEHNNLYDYVNFKKENNAYVNSKKTDNTYDDFYKSIKEEKKSIVKDESK